MKEILRRRRNTLSRQSLSPRRTTPEASWNFLNNADSWWPLALAKVPRLTSGSIAERKKAGLEILGFDPENHELLKRVDRCAFHNLGGRFPCNSPYCPHCSVPRNWRHLRSLKPGMRIGKEVVNYIGPRSGSRSRPYLIRAGQQAAIHFDGLPLKQVGAVTVMLGILRGGADYASEVRQCKKHLARALKSLDPDSLMKAYFRIEFVMKCVREIRVEFGTDRCFGYSIHELSGDEVVALVHAHGLIHVPGLGIDDLRRMLRREFAGKNQLHIRMVSQEILRSDGSVSGGAQGFMEYAGKRMTGVFGRNGNSGENTDRVAEPDTGEHQELLIKFLAEAEIYRSLHRFPMTVTRGIRRRSGRDRLHDEELIDHEEKLDTESVRLSLVHHHENTEADRSKRDCVEGSEPHHKADNGPDRAVTKGRTLVDCGGKHSPDRGSLSMMTNGESEDRVESPSSGRHKSSVVVETRTYICSALYINEHCYPRENT